MNKIVLEIGTYTSLELESCLSFDGYCSILLYYCTTWTLMKYLEKKLDGNYTGMLHALNKSWK